MYSNIFTECHLQLKKNTIQIKCIKIWVLHFPMYTRESLSSDKYHRANKMCNTCEIISWLKNKNDEHKYINKKYFVTCMLQANAQNCYG